MGEEHRCRGLSRGELIAGITALAAGAGIPAPVHAAATAPATRVAADVALARLKAGNARFQSGALLHKSLIVERRDALAGGQAPWASVVTCSDSRTGPELLFDAESGELFVVRVAGNFVTDAGLGTLEYGQSVLGSNLVFVLGHTSCGAVNATYDAVKSGKPLPPHLDAIQRAIEPGISEIVTSGGSKDEAVVANVKAQVSQLPARSPVLRKAVDAGTLRIVGGVYALRSGKVTLV